MIEALPYIQKYEGKTFVVKYGGAAQTETELKQRFAKDVTILKKIGINIVIVHGGGKEITDTAYKLGIETQFVNGHRFTDNYKWKLVETDDTALSAKHVHQHFYCISLNSTW